MRTSATRASNGLGEAVKDEQTPALRDQEDGEGPRRAPAHLDDVLRDVAQRVQQQAESWRDTLSVSIGRARALTNLEETRIRYFEDLGALQPSKATGQAGASRLYSLSDLRCLYALSLLVKDYDCKPAEAAKIVKAHRTLIESGVPGSISDLLSHEDSAATDAFVLARLLSQLLDAAQVELRHSCPEAASATTAEAPDPAIEHRNHARVIGLLLPMCRPALDPTALTPHDVQRMAQELRQAPQNVLVALDRRALAPSSQKQVRVVLEASGRDDSLVLFYSPEAWSIPDPEHCQYCLYLPEHRPDVAALLMVVVEPGTRGVPHLLRPRTRARITLFDRILTMCSALFPVVRTITPARTYWYRSDGFQIEHTKAAYDQLLERIRSAIFPDDPQSMAVTFIPDNLEHPTSLSVLAHARYDDDLAVRIKLDLRGEGQGLSGRAYNMREPFLSLDASADRRLAYAVEERCQAALAVPLMGGWSAQPFGVLYLASKSRSQALTSDVVYLALILGAILGELLGQWWLNRQRRARDFDLHERAEETVRWLDSLDQHGRDFERALDHVKAIWEQVARQEISQPDSQIALVVLDIDQYWQRAQTKSADLVPLAAQLHVRRAIRKIVPEALDYWFKNDHAFLMLENQDQHAAVATVRRIANQVKALPFSIPAPGDKPLTLSVSAAIKVMTYQDLYDLDSRGGEQLRQQMRAIIDDAQAQTRRSPGDTIYVSAPGGWQSA